MNDPLTRVAFSVYENKGVYALLLGSGLSRAALIPTGWDITLDLVRRVALAEGVEEQHDWAAWYRSKYGEEPNYSKLLEQIASSSDDRRSILDGYIEPTESERDDGIKIPTQAHHSIAKLIRAGYIRAVVTTNFDRLIENALREHGVEPTVVSSVDALLGAEPITHSGCFLLKLHGDYKDTRILNTEDELSEYPPEYDAVLDRIFDEFGLIVCGWSGEWDHALRSALLRAPNRRYSAFWASRGDVGDGAQTLIDHRKANLVQISDADGFFDDLEQRVETLSLTHRRNPLSIDLQVDSAKRFLAKPEHRIQLHDLVDQETQRVLDQLASDAFAKPGSWDVEVFRTYVSGYEAATETLAGIAGVMGRWGDGNELQLVQNSMRALHGQADEERDGLVTYTGFRSYPVVLLAYAYGLGLASSDRWKELHDLFNTKIRRQHRDSLRLIDGFFLGAWEGTEADQWKNIEAHKRAKTALSDYLYVLFSKWSKRFLGLAPDFERLFERFEILGSLAHLEQNTLADVRDKLSAEPQDQWVRMPYGRSVWNTRLSDELLDEMKKKPFSKALIEAGFARKNYGFLELFLENFKRISAKRTIL